MWVEEVVQTNENNKMSGWLAPPQYRFPLLFCEFDPLGVDISTGPTVDA